MVHFGDAASSTETTVRLGSSSYTGRVPIPQAKPENSFSNVSRRWPSYWSLVRGRTSSIHSELIPTTAKQQLPFHLPFLELTYMRVPIAVSFANEMRLDLIQPNHPFSEKEGYLFCLAGWHYLMKHLAVPLLVHLRLVRFELT